MSKRLRLTKRVRIAFLFLIATAITPSVSSACWFLPLPYHCGWSWNPFDPCGVFASNCPGGHCGLRRLGIRPMRMRGPAFAFRQNRLATRRANALARRTNRVCSRCSRLQRRQCGCGEDFGYSARGFDPLMNTAASCGAGMGTMACGPIPVTTQVPITTYRTVTVDMGSYQRVWVPRIVRQRVPQTTYQPRTIWMNQQPALSGAGMLPQTTLPLTTDPGQVIPFDSSPTIDGPMLPGSILPGTIVPNGSTLPLGSPYNGTIIGPGAAVTIPESSGDGMVPLPPPAAYSSGFGRSASLPRYGTYSDGYVNHDPAHVGSEEIVSDRALYEPESSDDWVDVEPSGSRAVTRSVEPNRYERRATSGLFSPVRPGTAAARMRYTGR